MKHRISVIGIGAVLFAAACAPHQAPSHPESSAPTVDPAEMQSAKPDASNARAGSECSSSAPIAAQFRIDDVAVPTAAPTLDIVILSSGHYRVSRRGMNDLQRGCMSEKDRTNFFAHVEAASFTGRSIYEDLAEGESISVCQAVPNTRYRLASQRSSVEWVDMCGTVSPGPTNHALARWMVEFTTGLFPDRPQFHLSG